MTVLTNTENRHMGRTRSGGSYGNRTRGFPRFSPYNGTQPTLPLPVSPLVLWDNRPSPPRAGPSRAGPSRLQRAGANLFGQAARQFISAATQASGRVRRVKKKNYRPPGKYAGRVKARRRRKDTSFMRYGSHKLITRGGALSDKYGITTGFGFAPVEVWYATFRALFKYLFDKAGKNISSFDLPLTSAESNTGGPKNYFYGYSYKKENQTPISVTNVAIDSSKSLNVNVQDIVSALDTAFSHDIHEIQFLSFQLYRGHTQTSEVIELISSVDVGAQPEIYFSFSMLQYIKVQNNTGSIKSVSGDADDLDQVDVNPLDCQLSYGKPWKQYIEPVDAHVFAGAGQQTIVSPDPVSGVMAMVSNTHSLKWARNVTKPWMLGSHFTKAKRFVLNPGEIKYIKNGFSVKKISFNNLTQRNLGQVLSNAGSGVKVDFGRLVVVQFQKMVESGTVTEKDVAMQYQVDTHIKCKAYKAGKPCTATISQLNI